MELCEQILGTCNLCNRIRIVADTPDSALDTATTVAVTAGSLIPVVLLVPGDPSRFSFWRRVFLIGAPLTAQLSGVMVVLLSGGWQLRLLHVAPYVYECSLGKVSRQLVDTAAYANCYGFWPIIIALCLLLVMEGGWHALSVTMKFAPPSEEPEAYDDDRLSKLLEKVNDQSNYIASYLHAAARVGKGTFSTRRLHSLPAFELPVHRHVEVLLAAMFAK